MKRMLVVSISAGALAFADSWTGTIVDVMCKGKDVANHTRQCALSCARGGYGLVLSDGKFVKFDETGNATALSRLKSSTKDKDMKARVTGKLDGDLIRVESIELQ
ncbi:MAG: hypothetical protein HY235_20960 [Acidobacteria bacterium]|nr:hypothetical protein [Acidobacteriota bacterium]